MMSTENYTKEQVQRKIADHFNMGVQYIFLPTRSKGPAAWFRQVYVYCLWKFTDMSVMEIGKHINRHHSIVTYSVDTINARCKVDKGVRSEIIEIESLFEDSVTTQPIKIK